MNDLISRKAAMVVIQCSGLDDDSKDTVVRVLEQLPSAQQEQTGRWSQVSGQATLCSCCGRASNAKQARNYSYCPYCGTKMEEMK